MLVCKADLQLLASAGLFINIYRIEINCTCFFFFFCMLHCNKLNDDSTKNTLEDVEKCFVKNAERRLWMML